MSFGRCNAPSPPPKPTNHRPEPSPDLNGETSAGNQILAVGVGIAVVGMVSLMLLVRWVAPPQRSSSDAFVVQSLSDNSYARAQADAQVRLQELQEQINRNCDQLYSSPTERYFCKQ